MTTVVFCHGMPGSEADANLLRQANPGTKVIALGLLEIKSAQVTPDLEALLDEALRHSNEKHVHLVGFSIGAMVAIRLAAMRPDIVSQLTLISPAAPLSMGDFLPKMAGKPVFDLALKHPKWLRLLTRLQGLVVRVSPKALIKMLFANCGTVEKELLNDPSFREVMIQGLSASLVRRPENYISYISAYVADWSDILREVMCHVTLWHGTKDTWSPPEMSKKLQGAFGQKATIHLVEDAEHYSTLTRAKL